MATAEKMVSERDAVLRERAAFDAGATAVQRALREKGYGLMDMLDGEWEGTLSVAAKRYPLPKVVRPRVWVDESGTGWKVEGGSFWYTLSVQPGLLEWKRDDPREVTHELTVERARGWADLLTNPTEELAV